MKRKKILSIVLGTVLVIAISMVLAFGAVKLVQRKNVIETGNVLGISWYNETDTEFVITTAEELKEFAKLSEYYTFENQTVKLDADIVLNEGNAVDFKEKKPDNKWRPILNFAGTFDGQGHTISGLYAARFGGETAVFVRSNEHCVVKDFSLKNSYFNTSGHLGVASIMANGGGDFTGIYSDAIIEHRGQNVAGIASRVDQPAKFEECWFDGNIHTTYQACGGLIDLVEASRVTLKHCLFSGSIESDFDGTGTLTTGTKTGGFVGHIKMYCTLLIEDCLSTGTIKIAGTHYTGGVIGVGSGNSEANIVNCYLSRETYRVPIGTSGGKVHGAALTMEEEKLTGIKAYEWTDLDFDTYWTAIENETPVLKRFAGEGLDLAGVEKAFDTSWYSTNEYVFTLTTPKQLYGWWYVSATEKFENKVVKLGADIVLNAGNAAKWGKKAPANKWTPIPTFAGTFDGQGHTISGIYSVSDELYHGFIKEAAETSTIRNLNIKNSFFYNNAEGNLASLGSLVGQSRGKVENIYSNAIVVSEGSQVGGIIGRMNDSDEDEKEDVVEIRGCWFDGRVSLIGEEAMEAGGIVGRAVQGDLIFENCLNTGAISAANKKSSPGLGGLMGSSWAKTLQMSNCFSDGKLTYAYNSGNGGAVGSMPSKYTVANITNVYTTKEACVEAGLGGSINGVLNGGVLQLPEVWFVGENAAKYTGLDFDKVWVLQKDGTPRLKYYTKGSLSAKGVAKGYDTSWYKKDAKEMVLKTPEQFLGFSIVAMTDDFAGRTVKLGADIPMNLEMDWLSIGCNAKLFAGTFDGQGHTISGIRQKGDSSQMGLFGGTSITSSLKNFSLKDSSFEYYNESANEKEILARVGTVCSDLRGDMEKVYSNATITSNGSYVGGITGSPNAVKDENGEYTTVTIKDCWFDGEVKMVGEWARYGGGIAGVMIQGNFEFINCLNSGTVSNERPTAGEFLGGIVGTDGNNYINCLIKDCLNTGTVTGVHWNSIGAILGAVNKKTGVFTIENTYALDTSCINHKGALVLANRNAGTLNGVVTALSEEELKGIGAYKWTELDFNNHWAAIQEGYPVLKSFRTGMSLDGHKRMVDTSWYSADKDSFTLEDEADLYGLAKLVNAKNTFKGKTVKLGADITINTGDAANYKTQAPAYKWTPIGSSEAISFKGTFDGNMHTISGIYLNNNETGFNGLFGYIVGATISNLRLENSYMESTKQNLGSIAGCGYGELSNIYSEANLKCSDAFEGGIIGRAVESNSKITNCWFAGNIVNDYSLGVNGAGYVGGFIGFVAYGSTVDLQDCLYTGHIDVSKVKASSFTGNAGLVGKSDATLNIKDCVVLGTAARDTTKNYIYAYVGGGKCNTLKAYATGVDSIWDGNYTGSCADDQKVRVSGTVTGFAARIAMPNLDWKNTWRAIDGGYPMQKVFADIFADEYVVDYVDTDWYDVNHQDGQNYKLEDKQDLYGLAALVSAGVSFEGETIELANDITINTTDVLDWENTTPEYNWEPIGRSEAKSFKGTFDGNMHTISGIYLNNDTAYNGLFGYIVGATISNLRLENSYMASTKQNLGSIAGCGYGNLSNIYSEAYLKCSDAFEGGIIGRTVDGNSKITNCLFNGTIVNDYSLGVNGAGYVGGFIGFVAYGSSVDLKDCSYTGHIDVSKVKASSFTGNAGLVGKSDATLNITDCLVLGTATRDTNKNYIYSYLGGGKCNTLKAYRLPSGWDGNYTGTVTTDQRVDVSGSVIGSAARTAMPNLDWVNTWRAIDGKLPMQKVFADEYVDTDWYDVDHQDGQTYKLKDRQDLYGLAALVNAGVSFEGKTIELTNDIAINTTDVLDWENTTPQYNWEPIGTTNKPFKGTLNGNGHRISGLYINTTSNYAGLFGIVSGATVENLKVVDSYIAGNSYVGSIAGKGSGTFTKIYSDAIVKNGLQYGGGIIGETDAATTMSKCWFAGTVINNNSNGDYSGFIGGLIGNVKAGQTSLTDCYTSGYLDVRGFRGSHRAGGFVGDTYGSGSLSLTNCVNVSGLMVDITGVYVYSIVGYYAKNVTASGVYSENGQKDENCVAWPGGYYGGGTNLNISYTEIDSNYKGNEAATKMTALDFTNTWQTTDGWPILRGVK